jgi:hypothetical protein
MAPSEFIEFQNNPETQGFLKFLNQIDSNSYLHYLKRYQDQYNPRKDQSLKTSKPRLSRLRLRKKKSRTQAGSPDMGSSPNHNEPNQRPQENLDDNISVSSTPPASPLRVWQTTKGLILVVTLSMLLVSGILAAILAPAYLFNSAVPRHQRI